MEQNGINQLAAAFGDMADPRVEGRCKYPLQEIIIMAICAVLSGAETWEEVEVFAETKQQWLGQFLEMKHGSPSHDTFRRVFSLLNAEAFQKRFMEWVRCTFKIEREQVVAIDGKSVRGSRREFQGQRCLHLVSAFATSDGLILGQCKVEADSNEIVAIPQLLEHLNLKTSIVTIDAMGTQTAIARQIIEQEADYVLTLKANQGRLYQDVVDWFRWAHDRQFREVAHDYHRTVNKGHGRLEIRECWVIHDPQAFEVLDHHERWVNLNTIVMLRRERRLPTSVETDIHYFISSLPPDARTLLRATRHHWRIENTLHWTLDVVLREDDSRLVVGDGAENFATLRRLAFNLLKHHPAKMSLKRKRYKAALDQNFLLDLLSTNF
jgi:predicted transposase YbfD/YdcC